MMQHSKIWDGEFDDYKFEPANKIERYQCSPRSIYDYDPLADGIESISLTESMIRNKHKVPRGNPTVCEGYGKVNHYPVQNLKDRVPNSNRIVPGHPELLRSTTCQKKGAIMDPSMDINFKAEGALREILFSNEKFEIPETDAKSQCDSGYHNDAYKIV